MDESNEINQYISDLFAADAEYESTAIDAATKKADYKITFAEEYLRAEGTVVERESTAIQNSSSELKAHYQSEAKERMLRERMHSLRDAIGGKRSILSAETKTNVTTAPFTT